MPISQSVESSATAKVRQTIEEHRTTIDSIRALPNFLEVLRSIPQTRDAFIEFSDDDILRAMDASSATAGSSSSNPRIAEFDLLASGAAVIGHDDPGSFLFAETLHGQSLKLDMPWDRFLKGVVKVTGQPEAGSPVVTKRWARVDASATARPAWHAETAPGLSRITGCPSSMPAKEPLRRQDRSCAKRTSAPVPLGPDPELPRNLRRVMNRTYQHLQREFISLIP